MHTYIYICRCLRYLTSSKAQAHTHTHTFTWDFSLYHTTWLRIRSVGHCSFAIWKTLRNRLATHFWVLDTELFSLWKFFANGSRLANFSQKLFIQQSIVPIGRVWVWDSSWSAGPQKEGKLHFFCLLRVTGAEHTQILGSVSYVCT